MNQQPRKEEGLTRAIRRWDLVAIAINSIIGAGIFGLPSRVYGLIGTYSLIAFVVCALVVTLIVLCFAEVSSRFDETGGPYLYVRKAFGAEAGFGVGWLMWLMRLMGFATNCNLLVAYLGYFWPGATQGLPRAFVITLVVGSLTTINILGVRDAAVVTNIFTIGKLIPIVLFVGAGLFFIDTGNFSFRTTGANYETFSTSVLLLVYAFTGFEMAVIPAGEVKNPGRDMPLALLVSIAVVALLYILIQFVCIGTLPELAASERPLADAGSRFLGTAGASIISAGALISITGNLNTIVLSGSRLPFAMAEQRQLPQIFRVIHPRFRTPHFSILLSGALMLILTVSSTFIYALTIATITRLIVYASTCLALPVLRRRTANDGVPPAMFTAPAGVALSIITLFVALWLLSNITGREARDAAIAASFGFVIYFAYRAYRA